jgi:hypothetical protein
MITLAEFFVFLAAAALPVTYVFLLRRWLEPEYEQVHSKTEMPATRMPMRSRVEQPA